MYCRSEQTFYFGVIKAALIKFGAAPISIKVTAGYIAFVSVPIVILILDVLLESIATLLYDSSRFSFLAYNRSDRTIRPFSFPLIYDKSLLEAAPTIGDACR